MTTRTAGSTSVNRGQQRQTTPIRCWETNVSCPARLLSAQLFSRREKRTSRSPATKIAARGSSRVFRSLVRKRRNVAQLSVVDVASRRLCHSNVPLSSGQRYDRVCNFSSTRYACQRKRERSPREKYETESLELSVHRSAVENAS